MRGNEEITAVMLDPTPLWFDAVAPVFRRLRIHMAGRTTSAPAALNLIEQLQPDVFLTEIRLGSDTADGLTALRLKTAKPDELASAIRQVFCQSVYFPGSRGIVAEAFAEEARKATTLTPREFEILGLVAAGSQNAEVASALWVTEQTVKFHLSNIYKKLGVSNRTEASRWAHQSGIIGDSPMRLSVA
jgi:DNA-binding NarL/FixJ family response regulator